MANSGVLVTGGSGTFGRAFIRSALFYSTYDRVVSLSRDEQKVAALGEEFGHDPRFRAFVGDVRDRDRLRDACRGITTVVMAAALKRVDVTCYNPEELFKTNVLGIENTIRAAVENGARRVLLISSDKAVSPTNPYGVSKAMAESMATSSNVWAYPRGTMVSALRYGNVLGSRGSVVHIWRQQIARGEPITLTDRRMTRFLLTIEDAIRFANSSLEKMRGGEVFIPSLPSTTMVDLARAVAPRAGYPVIQTGLRPGGEKLAECLLNEEEATRTIDCGESYVIKPSHREWSTEPWPGIQVESMVPFRSDTNTWCLEEPALREMISRTEACR